MRLNKKISLATIALASSLACLPTGAQNNRVAEVADTQALRLAAQKAIESNPELSARLNALRASNAAVDVAKGGWLPRVDLEAGVGTSTDRISTRTPQSESQSRSSVALNLTQVLWDAQVITSEINRAGHEKAAKWFEWLDAIETTAVEAARAHYDVVRYRSLLSLAQESLAQHRTVAALMQSRVAAGVGRGVDLEQSNARLALAETNVTTEAANLHDVTARYVRVVGERPAERIGRAAPITSAMPQSETQAIQTAIQSNPGVSAAIEGVRAARAANDARKGAAWQPRVEARVRAGSGRNFDGVLDQKRDASAEIALNWNLFNGGADQARIRQSAAQIDQAADLRDKACRDARQVASIAYNEMLRYTEQLQMFNRNVQATEKARDAYRQQFEIGQRSLLDLLNSENELYTAKRARANAETEMLIAQTRVLAAAQKLTAHLGLTREDPADVQAPQDWSVGNDAPSRCPVIAIEGLTAQRVLAATPPAPALRMAAPAPAPAPQPVAAPAPAPRPAPPAAVRDDSAALAQRVRDWAAAWSAKDFVGYRGFYAGNFAPSGASQAAWLEQRKRMLGKPGAIAVKVTDIEVRNVSTDTVETRFKQNYTSKDFRDSSAKSLVWKRMNDQWVIVSESNR
jgi:outer membrane protein, adhesin transport system